MKAIYKTAAAAVAFTILMAACGNAGAQNDKKDQAKTKAVTELNTEGFKAKVYDLSQDELKYLGTLPAIVDFTAVWCGPCQKISPILDEVAKEYEGKVAVYKVDVDKNRELVKAFNVSSIPAVLYIPLDGEPVMTVGARDKGKFVNEIKTILLRQ